MFGTNSTCWTLLCVSCVILLTSQPSWAQSVNTGPDGILQSVVGGDDVATALVGNGCPNTDGVTSGPNGICESLAAGDDVNLFPVGQGRPNCLAVTFGANGVNDTVLGGDDVVGVGGIRTGPDGVCDTVAAGDDVQVIPLGEGSRFETCIDTGPDGIFQSLAAGDDTTVLVLGQGLPFATVITCGANGIGESVLAGDDLNGPCTVFTRGDCNGDAAGPNLVDALFLLNFLFVAGAAPPCMDACDAEDGGTVNLADALFMLTFSFLPCSPPPPEPFACPCGDDLTPDALTCAVTTCP